MPYSTFSLVSTKFPSWSLIVTVCLLISNTALIVKSFAGILLGTSMSHPANVWPNFEYPSNEGAVTTLL